MRCTRDDSHQSAGKAPTSLVSRLAARVNRPPTGWTADATSSTSRKSRVPASAYEAGRQAVQRYDFSGGDRRADEESVAAKASISRSPAEERIMDDTLLRIFIAVTTFAVVVQAGILVGLYLSVRKSTAKMDALATELKEKAIPTMETVQSFIVESSSKNRDHRRQRFRLHHADQESTRTPRRHAHRRFGSHASTGNPRRRASEPHHG